MFEQSFHGAEMIAHQLEKSAQRGSLSTTADALLHNPSLLTLPADEACSMVYCVAQALFLFDCLEVCDNEATVIRARKSFWATFDSGNKRQKDLRDVVQNELKKLENMRLNCTEKDRTTCVKSALIALYELKSEFDRRNN